MQIEKGKENLMKMLENIDGFFLKIIEKGIKPGFLGKVTKMKDECQPYHSDCNRKIS